MPWYDNLRNASFRGVQFKVAEYTGQFGRRLAPHIYPQQDQPFIEDLGRGARKFQFNAYVVGANWQALLFDLINACEERGEGTLVHPYPAIGEQIVACALCQVKEKEDEGQFAQVKLEFIEQSTARYPAKRNNTFDLLDRQAQIVREESLDFFQENWDILTVPGFVLDSAQDAVDIFTLLTQDEFTTSDVNTIGRIFDLDASKTTIIKDAIQFPSAMEGILSAFQATTNDSPRVKSDKFESVAEQYETDKPTETTATRQREGNNARTMDRFVKAQCYSFVGQNAARIDFPSYDDANAYREMVSDGMDSLIEELFDGNRYQLGQQILRLKNLVSADVTARAANLARLRTVTLPIPLPDVVLAYHLYDDAERAAELVERNEVKHPTFLKRSLRVLDQ